MIVLNPRVLLWNITFYLLSVLVIILAIQHSMFFYSWPPDLDKLIYVPWYIYFVLGVPVYFLFKVSHFIEKRGTIIKSYR